MNKIAIDVHNLQKIYALYPSPHDRLKQLLFGKWKKYFQEYPALKNINFSVGLGECVGIIGRNGSGKSTLLQILAGTMSQTAGTVTVNGRVAAVLELGSGFNPDFSGRQNVMLYASLFELSSAQIEARMSKIEEFADIGEFIDHPVKTYSSGMQARLAFAVIAHVDADILIIDEALSVGDAAFNQKCMRFIREFKKRGSILFVSHDMGAINAFCDKAIWINEGEVQYCGSAKDASERYYSFMQNLNSGLNTASHGEREIPGLIFEPPMQEADATILSSLVVSQECGTVVDQVQRVKCFGFNIDSNRHGNGDARIIDVKFLTTAGHRIDLCKSGTEVVVRMRIAAIQDVAMPIVGFIIKDRHGQPLIGGNTFHSYEAAPVGARAGEFWEVEFVFKLPILAIGDYSIVAAIGSGTLAEHIHLDWVHDAVLFKVTETSIDGVIVGVPLDKIRMTVYSPVI